jgi:biotin carboxyl carrier protein
VSRRRIRLVLEGAGSDGPEDVLVFGDPETGAWKVERGGVVSAVEASQLADGRLSLVFDDGRQFCGRALPENGGVVVAAPSAARRVPLSDPRYHLAGAHHPGAEGGREEVRALMPGRVLDVRVAEGDTVPAGGVLLVLEAMKMQNEIRAPRASRVVQVAVASRQAVEGGALMMVLDDPEDAPRSAGN